MVRSEFDKLRWDHACQHGPTVQEETRVCGLEFDDETQLVQVSAIGPNGQQQSYYGRFLIDASRRNGFMATATRNRWRKSHAGFERTALWTHWTDIKSLSRKLKKILVMSKSLLSLLNDKNLAHLTILSKI